MSRSFTGASSHHLIASSSPITVYPMSMSAWFYPTASGANAAIMSICVASGTSERLELIVSSTNVLRYGHRANATTTFADAAGNTSLNRWQHAGAVGVIGGSSFDFTVYRDGGNSGSNSALLFSPTLFNQVVVGARGGNTITSPWTGRIAEVALWSTNLSAAEFAVLAAGVSPRKIRPSSLVGYWPVWGIHSPEIDLYSPGRTLTVSGATLDNHAPVVPFYRSIYQPSFWEVEQAPAAARRGGTWHGSYLGPVNWMMGDYLRGAAKDRLQGFRGGVGGNYGRRSVG